MNKLTLLGLIAPFLCAPISAQEVLYEIAGEPGFLQLFGEIAAPLDDLNGDGIRDFILGAPNETVGDADFAGSAYVYSGADGSLILAIQEDKTFHQLGSSVAPMSDLDGDGVGEFLLGVPGGPNATAKGRVRVYSGATGISLFAAASETNGDYLGQHCAAIGDVNGDAVADFAGAAQTYAAVFSGVDGTLIFSVPVIGSVAPIFVGGPGDINADGHADLLVANSDVIGGIAAYSGFNGELLYTVTELNLFGLPFGVSITVLADLDGDGVREFASGGPASVLSTTGVFSGADGSMLREHGGAACALLEDLSNDGVADYSLLGPSDGFDESAQGVLRYYSGRTGYVLETIYLDTELNLPVIPVDDINGDGTIDQLVVQPHSDTVQLWSSRALALYHTPSHLQAGQDFTLVIREGGGGDVALLALTGVDDQPLFQILTPLLAFDGTETIAFHFEADPALVGIDVELTALASVNGDLVISDPDVLSVAAN